MRQGLWYGVVALAAVFAAIPQSKAQTAVFSGCELHVWPANNFHSTYYGWVHGGTVDGGLKRRDGYQPLSHALLSTQRQVEELGKLPIGQWLGIPDYRTIVHESPLGAQVIRETRTRYASGGAACYAELVVVDVVLQENVLAGTALNVIYRFRRFDGGEGPVQIFGSYVLQPIKARPIVADPIAANDDRTLVNAFNMTVEKFGRALQQPPRRRGR